MNFLEKNIEDIIFETPNEKLNERGLEISGNKKRQVYIGNYGTADLLTLNRKSFFKFNKIKQTVKVGIFELKLDEINNESYFQLLRYVNGIKIYIENFNNWFQYKNLSIVYNMYLIGKSIKYSDIFYYHANLLCPAWQKNNILNLQIYTYSYKFDGIFFEKFTDYSLEDSGFKRKFKNLKISNLF